MATLVERAASKHYPVAARIAKRRAARQPVVRAVDGIELHDR